MNRSARRFEFEFDDNLVVTEKDVIMGYEIFLRRLPESSWVIEMKLNRSPWSVLDEFLTSSEFYGLVLKGLGSGQPLPHERFKRSPSAKQLEWLKSFIRFDADEWKSLEQSATWEQFFRRLLGIGARNRLVALPFELKQATCDFLTALTSPEDMVWSSSPYQHDVASAILDADELVARRPRLPQQTKTNLQQIVSLSTELTALAKSLAPQGSIRLEETEK